MQPDTKDWTWVLNQACPDCGWDVSGVPVAEIPAIIREDAGKWQHRLAQTDAKTRPNPEVWSPTEYGAHVRDVHVLFAERVQLILSQDNPQFANWDQDATAIERNYAAAEPTEVAGELAAAAERVAALYETVQPEQLTRPGTRSNGSVFTLETLAQYHLHDVVHHSWDVR